ncbi:MAG TPA: EF-hand domain-containing protein [Oscillatoriaceae cyanobacterium M33_DOE_052]|uniref:thiol oxidase n=1 Tax=Planktothricoides sp. SpSt-374 TaxID=2282167 RepID=A0A7C3VF84_9CYAN|nr:EF-hand domain-containing protein [Oscillatoriaceae cyanobacterium M33_DOE_052]
MTSAEMTKSTISEAEVQKLWEAFTVFDADGSGAISVEELGQVVRSLGQNPSDIELREMIKEVDVDASGTIDFEEFKALMVAQRGDRISRLKLAFSVFDEDGSGHITADEMKEVMGQFGLTEAELEEMLKEVDFDGDGSIDFEEFCKLVPEQTTGRTYTDSPAVTTPPKPSTPTTPAPAASSAPTSEVDQLKQLLSQHPRQEPGRGTSRLQMQIGLFRLVQGAAYRSFRENFSANSETHLRAKNLPYRIGDFTKFVAKAIAVYKGLGIVDPACHPVLDAVAESIQAEYARLQERIANWATIEKTPEMLAEEQAMLEARSKSTTVREKFAAGVEFAITMKKKHISLSDVVEGVLAINELNRLRQMDLNQEMAPPPPPSGEDPKEYLKKWNRVIIDNADEQIDGAMMPAVYWYEDFMPKLLAAFSVTSAADIQENTIPNEAALNKWYEEAKAAGEFGRYAADVAENFPNCSPKQKLEIKQAWNLTRHYLNGVQKRRERQEFGRESGALSHYVSFIDVYLGRSDIKDAQMRISFPYFIGPAVWRFFHTTAEIVCTKTPEEQKALVAVFQEFFKLFATMYPCPYCRYHLNMYVVQNKEVEMYPMEYLVLGRDPNLSDFEVSINDKLSTVADGPSLRLFFWKLHNTVSSSIARTEQWYHKDERAFYTSRYWPSLDSELARSQALKHVSIATDRLYRVYALLKPMARLAGLRAELQKLLEKGDAASIQEACDLAQSHIKDLEEAVVAGNFLPETYKFDPELVDASPNFTPEEEEFSRSGYFVEAT